MNSSEKDRLLHQGQGNVPLWYKWGPYVSERAWGTVREDYSLDGDAWGYFPFELAHKKTYRWGEDGIAGFCDRYQILVFAPAFWNGKDAILKERLFGLSSPEGNHGEDVKEYYYYLDATPTHSYLKYLYKYPQSAFPYELLKRQNAKRTTREKEYELIDTGIFNDNRYFDIYVEYAKAEAEDIYIRIEAINRGPDAADLHIVPQLWFRNQWSWGEQKTPQPVMHNISTDMQHICLLANDTKLASPANLAFDYHLNQRYLYASEVGAKSLLFTNNEDESSEQLFSKDAFHRAIVNGEDSINREEQGTKAGIHYFFKNISSGESVRIYLRLTNQRCDHPLVDAENIIHQRKREADKFYADLHPKNASEDEKMIQRQALAGMIWNKQIYLYDVSRWLKGDKDEYAVHEPQRMLIRNTHWRHLNSMRIFSMPDKWEYPWFAAWDLAFHCITFSLIDIEFAKEQLWLLLFDQFQHPNGAIPAYEWEFSDLNPPVQAWAAYKLFKIEYEKTGKKDLVFLKKCYLKLLMNFAFWVNKVDSSGCNVFEGGFLGLDNITIIDRSKALTDMLLKQADGTGWMAMFCLNLMRIALELAKTDPTYDTMATKFFQHFVYIAHAMKKIGFKQYNLWDEADGFFYDVLVHPEGHRPKFETFRVRSMVGLVPLFAIEVVTTDELNRLPEFKKNFFWFLHNRPELIKDCITEIEHSGETHYVLSLADEHRLQNIVTYLNNPEEFLSPFGIRSLSKYHQAHPFKHDKAVVGYEPGESMERMKGGNSNWRGPIWFPTNYLLIESLLIYQKYFKIDSLNISDLANRLIALFGYDQEGKRRFFGNDFPLAKDPYFKDNLFFYEFFHAETGQGLGALHQTGWTGLVANLIDEFRR